jgi:hypothetical protein
MYKLILSVATAICPLTVSLAFGQPESSPIAANSPQPAERVQVLSAGQMSREDAGVLAANREALASAAELNGYDVRSGSWIQNQVTCPDAPRHVIMHFVKISPDGSVSLFTAAVPRSNLTPGQQLRVRIVPVLYHGAPAFHVFGSIPWQRQLVNEVIPAKRLVLNSQPESDWKTLAYCYAALTGAEPAAKSVTAPDEVIPIIEKTLDGRVVEMHFSAIGPDRMSQNWRIAFDHQAQVTGIFLSAHSVGAPQVVPKATPVKTHPVPDTQHPVPDTQVKTHPVPDTQVKSRPVPESH